MATRSISFTAPGQQQSPLAQALGGGRSPQSMIALNALQQGTSSEPVGSLGEGFARFGNALLGGTLAGMERNRSQEAGGRLADGLMGMIPEAERNTPRGQALRAALMDPDTRAMVLSNPQLMQRFTGQQPRIATPEDFQRWGIQPIPGMTTTAEGLPNFDQHNPGVAGAITDAQQRNRPIVGGGFTGVLPPGYFDPQTGARPAPGPAMPGPAAPPQMPMQAPAGPMPGPTPLAGGAAAAPGGSFQANAARAYGGINPAVQGNFSTPDELAQIDADLTALERTAGQPGQPGAPAPVRTAQAGGGGVAGGTPAYAQGFVRGPRGELSPAQPPPNSPEGAQDRIIGETLGNQYRDVEAAATAARGQRLNLERLRASFEGIDRGGPAAETGLRIRALGRELLGPNGMSMLGIDDTVPAEQVAQALSREVSLQLRNPAGGAGMPGAMSDADREFLVSMTPSLAQTPQGRTLLIDARMRTLQREQEIASFTRQYMRSHGGRLDLNFGDALHTHFSAPQRQLFGQEFQNRRNQILSGAGDDSRLVPVPGQPAPAAGGVERWERGPNGQLRRVQQ